MCFPVTKCCFCVSLEVGTKVISIISLVSSVGAVAVYAGAALTLPPSAQSKQCFYMLVAAIALCQSVICGLMVYGAFWSKPRYLWPWLVTSWISCGSLALLSLLGVVLLTIQYYRDADTLADISTMSTFYFVYAAVVYYFVTVVQSRRVQMIHAKETESAETLMRRRHIPKSLLV